MNPPTLPDYIKPGAFVKLRDGSKGEIYSTDNAEPYTIHGRTFSNRRSATWTNNLTVWVSEEEPEQDIIGPWTDTPDCSKLWPLLPPWIKYLAQDKDGIWLGHMYKPDLKGCCWESSANSWMWYITIPQEYQPIFEGDWKDSLVERPQ